MKYRISTLGLCCFVSLLNGCGNDASNLGNAGHDDAGPDPAAGGATSTKGGASNAGGASSAGGTSVKGGAPGNATGGGLAAGGTAGGGGAAGASGSGSGGKRGSGGSGGNVVAPPSNWVNVTGSLAGAPTECGTLGVMFAHPGSNAVIAGVCKNGLYETTDGGKNWKKLGTGAGSAEIVNRPSYVLFDPDHADVFYESGTYGGGGLYRTKDGGETLQQLGTVGHNDLLSVDFTDPDRKTILAGGHEQNQTLYLSTDGGATFENIGKNMPSDSNFSSWPLVLDSKTFLVGACGYGQGACGVFRSTDGGKSWNRAGQQPVFMPPLVASDGSIYWSLIYDGGMVRSTDHGQTWTQTTQGGSVSSASPVELPDGRILSVSGDHVKISDDQAKTWKNVGDATPFKPAGVAYSAATKTLFVWHGDCGSVVASDAIASAGFDYTKE